MEDLENYVEKSNEAMSGLSSTSFVERVAATTWESSRQYYKKLANIDLAPWDEESDGLRKERCDHVRMVIEAMREPTRGMIDAFYKVESFCEPTSAIDGWTAMIDEALK